MTLAADGEEEPSSAARHAPSRRGPAGDGRATGGVPPDDPNGLVAAQLPARGDKIAVGAWNAPEPSGSSSAKRDLGEGILALCPRFDEEALETFVDKHRYNGPERPPRETLEPGVGH